MYRPPFFMSQKYRAIYCPLMTARGRVCNSYLGDMSIIDESHTDNFLCRNHKPSRKIEFKITSEGTLLYRELKKSEFQDYHDNPVRLSNA